MNQFNKFKDFVHGNLSKNDRQILSSVVMKKEKHMENIKSTLITAEKKLSNSLISPKGSEQDKKTKKFPSASLNKFFNEASETLSASQNDSVLSKTLLTCSLLQNEFTNILAEHESDVEKNCLDKLKKYLNEDLPSIHRTRKQLNKANEEWKTSRTKYESLFMKTNSTQLNPEIIQNKIEPLKKEVEYNEHKLEQSRDAYEIEIFDFLGKELDISEIFLQYIKLLEIYHQRMLNQIHHYIPVLEGVLQNTSQKPVFRVPLEEHLRSSGRKISVVIEKCVEYLCPFIKEEGLFRISGSISKVKRMRNAFNSGLLEALNDLKNDPPAVASTLKSYLRELPEPLLTFKLYSSWIKASKETDQSERLKAIWKVCNMLPEANRNNLCYLLKFLHELTKHSEQNKMSSQNLAIALGPSLLWSEGDSYDLNTSNHLPTLVEVLITYCDYFFPDETFPDLINYIKTIENSLNDNHDSEISSPNNRNQHLNNSNNMKKKPAPKPPSQSSLESNLIENNSAGLKRRSKIGSFKFKTNSNKSSQENVTNIFEKPQSSPTQTDTPLLAIFLPSGIAAPVIPDSNSYSQLVCGTKNRPKSVCERPLVAPPSVPPRPSVTKSENYPTNTVEMQSHVDKYPDLNHIDSESEENCTSTKDLNEFHQNPILDGVNGDNNFVEYLYPLLTGIEDENPSTVMSTPSPTPRKPPRINSNNLSDSLSNLSLNDAISNNNIETNMNKQHQQSGDDSLPLNNNNGDTINKNPIKTLNYNDNQTYL